MRKQKLSKNFKLTTPVLFLVFNRLDTTQKVFVEIRKAKPTHLFIAADGPRDKREKEKTEAVRKYILENINWKCKVMTLFRERNLGCKYAVSSAITWFFENVEQGIILEDDCLPSQSFFRFCQEILNKYKDSERIMHVSGTNVEGISKTEKDYFLSETFNVWGWATWKRAWTKYRVEMPSWPRYRIKIIKLMKNYSLLQKIKSWRLYYLTYIGSINTWDYQWDYICKISKGFSIIPAKNLITNLGFMEGTHTTNYNSKDKVIKRWELKFPFGQNKLNEVNKNYIKNFFRFFS